MLTADVDGDGRMDVVTLQDGIDETPATLVSWLSTGTATLRESFATDLPRADVVGKIAAWDFDDNGSVDVVFCPEEGIGVWRADLAPSLEFFFGTGE